MRVREGSGQEEREKLAKTIHGMPRGQVKMGKPEILPDVVFSLLPDPCVPSLSTFVTPNSWGLFDMLGLSGPNDWLLAPCSVWSVFTEYRAIQTFVKNVPVINDIAERVRAFCLC